MSSYSDYSAGRKNRTETDLGGNYERGVTRFVQVDLVVQFSMIEKSIIETVKATLKWGCSSAGRAPALQAGGHGFDSHHLHQPAVPAAKIGEVSKKPADITRWKVSGKRTETSEAKGDSNQRP